MSSINDDVLRRLVPRWRYASSAVPPAETVADRARPAQHPTDERQWEEKCKDWAENPGIETAADLMAAATALNRLPVVREAIRYLSEHQRDLRSGPKALLLHAIGIVAPSPSSVPDEGSRAASTSDPPAGRSEARGVITGARARLRGTPRDAIAWMDMARAYTTLGQTLQAENAMDRALALAPDARVVIRAACRRLVHTGRADQAHRLLLRHPRTRHDPWLIAAEIAIAQILDTRPKLAHEGRVLIESANFSPAGLTELAGALGTLEFFNGSTKRARKLVQLSMEAPS